MIDNDKFGEEFSKCVKQSGEVYQPIRIEPPIGQPSPDAPTVKRWPEHAFLESTPSGLTMPELRNHHEEFKAQRLDPPAGPTGETVALCLSTATDEQLRKALVAINKEVIARSIATAHATMPPRQGMSYQSMLGVAPDYFGVDGPTPSDALRPPSLMEPRKQRFEPVITVSQHLPHSWIENELRMVMGEAEDLLSAKPATALVIGHDNIPRPLNAEDHGELGLTITVSLEDMQAFIDAGLMRPHGSAKVFPYLLESVHIESCPVIGKQPPEAIDLSEESI